MSVAQTTSSRFTMFMVNPMVRKLDNVQETSTTHATYGGIIRKTLFLLALTIVGAIIFFMTNSLAPTSYNYVVEGYSVNMLEAGIVLGSMVFTLFAPFIAFKFVKTSMVLGSIYSLAQGYTLAFVCHLVGSDYLYPVALAFVLTLIIVAVMLLIYRMHLISIHKKFMSVIATLFFTSIVIGMLMFAISLFPQTRFLYDMLTENMTISLIVGIIGIVFVCLFLLVDFEVINHCVRDHLPKKYEWLAAFALSFSIIDLYLKVLNLVLKVTQKQE